MTVKMLEVYTRGHGADERGTGPPGRLRRDRRDDQVTIAQLPVRLRKRYAEPTSRRVLEAAHKQSG